MTTTSKKSGAKKSMSEAIAAPTAAEMHEAIESGTYETIRRYLQAALEQFLAAGRSAYELAEFAIDKFGQAVIPYLTRFQQEIRDGQVCVQQLADAARTAVFGVQVTATQREQMIREAAYFAAERRGFVGGDQDQDWVQAQQQVDALLERQAGILQKARKTFDSVVVIAEQELTQVKTAVEQWLADRHLSGKTSGHSPTL